MVCHGPGPALALPWPCPGLALALPWPCSGPALALRWPCVGPALALVLPWPCPGQGQGRARVGPGQDQGSTRARTNQGFPDISLYQGRARARALPWPSMRIGCTPVEHQCIPGRLQAPLSNISAPCRPSVRSRAIGGTPCRTSMLSKRIGCTLSNINVWPGRGQARARPRQWQCQGIPDTSLNFLIFHCISWELLGAPWSSSEFLALHLISFDFL